ncbi:MAG: M28 family peptidase, partial [Candidatus Marinimicrobia bacterium]|nr:M28 family peptidase [Candidatus Neomarinimicrobiota bacterium]
RKRRKRPPPDPERVSTAERNAFYKKEGVSVILETRGNRVAMVPGYARPGAKKDKWDRQGTINHLPIVTVTPEHYNRMYRILERDIPVRIVVEINTKIGRERQWARNVIGEISGSDLKDEVVMLGAHFDTWHASPNASDNTSGTAVMLEAIRILKAVGVTPRRTIRIALW